MPPEDEDGWQSRQNKIVIQDEALINEINFCHAAGQQGVESFKDRSVLVRGSN